MGHALDRVPIDICRARSEAKVVLGNSGIAQIIAVGPAVSHVREGDFCLFGGACPQDEFGYMTRAHAYDAPNTVGLLAKISKAPGAMFTKLPETSRFSLRQWAAFSLRYPTAWSNWKVALGALRLQVGEEELPCPHVWGWGGGTTLAELRLAQIEGCASTMISGTDGHLAEIRRAGMRALDRRELGIIDFDEQRYAAATIHCTKSRRRNRVMFIGREGNTSPPRTGREIPDEPVECACRHARWLASGFT